MSKILVFILAGQSNLVGPGFVTELPPELANPQTDVLLHYWIERSNHVIPIVESTEWGSLQTQTAGAFGPDISFGRSIADTLEIPVAIVKVAANASSLASRWGPDDADLYPILIERWNLARQQLIDAGWEPEVAGFIWVQGSGDCWSQSRGEDYLPNLQAFETALRTDIPGDYPIIQNQQHIDTNRPADGLAALRISKATFSPGRKLVNADDLALKIDFVHYTSDTTITVGERLADACIHHRADLNDDGIVDINDLLDLLLAWGGVDGDVDGNDLTDVRDLLILLQQWGS